MKQENEDILYQRYPKIFDQTLSFGFECKDGWFNIIYKLCDLIQYHIDWSEDNHARNTQWMKIRDAALEGDWEPFNELYGHFSEKDIKFYESLKADILDEIPNWRIPKPVIPQVVAVQVKEKFGTLRFYFNGGDDHIDGLVAMAEGMSSVTCEECGVPGKLRKGSWVQTLCDQHAEGREEMVWNNPFDKNDS